MKISIITPLLNSRPWIRECVESVARQSVKDCEHLVIDGGSSDGTINELERLAREHPHLRWHSSIDRGQSDAMNFGFLASTGSIIGFLNADDYFADNALASVLEALASNPEADIVVGNLVIINNEGSMLLRSSIRMIDLLFYQSYKWPLNPSCYFYRRQVQHVVGPFPIDEHFVMDYWFLLRAFRDFKSVRIDTVLGSFRIHDHNKSQLERNIGNRLESRKREFLLERKSLPWRLLWQLLNAVLTSKVMMLRLLRYSKRSLLEILSYAWR